jgi:deoxyribose-phosphate aldolase
MEAMAAISPDLPARIDHTLLRPQAGRDEVLRLADEAARHGLAAAVVLPRWVSQVRRRLEGTGVATCSVVGFPLAHELPATLAAAARALTGEGAEEIDMVLSTGALRSGEEGWVVEEVATVASAGRETHPSLLLKVIVETHLLDDTRLARACLLIAEGGADFVKTTTGFTGGGATPEETGRLRRLAPPVLRVKASSGIRSLEQALALVAAGADRLGTSDGASIARAWQEGQDAHAL